MEEKEVEVSLDKIYNLPKIKFVWYKHYCLAIAPDIAKWIVLYNNEQMKIFELLLGGVSIQEVLAQYKDFQEDIVNVLTQIEAKQLENPETTSNFSNTRLHLHLTNRCNLRCPHCYMKSGHAYDDELSTEEIKILFKNFRNVGGTHISITGGEPTVRADFFELVEYISHLGMKASIFSNGFSWDEEDVVRLTKQSVEGVQISIDGYDENTNSQIRGKGVFARALNTVDLLVKNKIYVKVAITAPYEMLRDHQQEYIKFSRNLINKYGKDAIECNYSYFFMPGRELNAEKIKQNKDSYYKLVDGVVHGVYGDVKEDAFVSNLKDCIYDSCGFGGLNILANGDFYFCDRIPDVNKGGNIREMTFEDVFKYMKIAEKAGKIDNFKPCCSCELKYICGGGCRAEYYTDFTKAKDITCIDFEKIKPRKCTEKEKYYDLMVKTNERFFS